MLSSTRKLLTILLLLCILHNTEAQNTEADSLKKLLIITKESPQRVIILEGLSYAYVSAFPDTALEYALQGLALAQKINYRVGEAYCTNAIANVYFGVGDYAKALEMYLRSLQMKEKLEGQNHAIAVTYFNIANVYTEQEDYPHALDYVFKAKSFDEKVKDSASIMFDLYSLSSIYLRMKKMDSALYYAEQSTQLAGRLRDKNMIGAILNNYGEIHSALNNFTLASKYYHQSIYYVQAINDNEVLASDYYGLAKVFKAQGQFDSSVFFVRKAITVAREAPFLKPLFDASTFLADMYKTNNQYDSAFKYLTLSIATKDSLYNVEKIKKVQNLKLSEQQRQQAIEVDKIKFRNRIKLYAFIIVSAVFLAIALVLWRNNKQKQKAYTLLKQQIGKTEQAMKELKSTQAHLLQKEKMASLGELTAGIAHEIQNPLNFITNFSEINTELIDELKEERQKNNVNSELENEIYEDMKRNLKKIIHHGKRADAIVKNMLEHSRVSNESKQLTDINLLAEEYLKFSWNALRIKDKSFNAEIKSNFDPALQKTEIFRQEMGRVLINLFNNAFYAVSEKKKVADANYKPLVSVATKKIMIDGNDGIEIRVRDNGNGIPPHALHKIFQPFFTTKPTGQGTGLGLSLSYDIITKVHDGELKVDTKEGEYSEFIIQIPV